MSPALLATIPHADPLPLAAPGGLIWALLLLTYLLHLLPMNFILGGSLIGALSRMRAASNPHHALLSAFLTKAMPPMIAATITFGVAPLLLVQVLYGRLFFTSSVLMGWYWAAVVPLLVIGYYAAYLLAFKGEQLGGFGQLASWVATLSFLAIAVIYTSNMSLMLRPDTFAELYAASPKGLHMNLGDKTFWPRLLHTLFGAVAVSGFVVAFWGVRKKKVDEALGRWAIKHGALWFTIATAVNVIWGMWWLVALPRETMLRFMGQNTLATAALGLGMLFALGALGMMAMAIVAQKPEGLVRGSISSLLLTLVAMIIMRDQVRQGALDAAGFEPVRWVETQWGPLLLFLALLVAAIVVTVWMVLKLVRSRPA